MNKLEVTYSTLEVALGTTLPYYWVQQGDSSYLVYGVVDALFLVCQVTDASDIADFEATHKVLGNQVASEDDALVLGRSAIIEPSRVSTSVLQTYVAETALAGANNKDMISIFNPVGSGKVIKVLECWAVVPASSGATVVIPFELRSATAITTGTLVTMKPLDSTDAAASAQVRAAPTGITDHASPLYWTWIEQINTAQGGTENMSHTMHDSSGVSNTQPVTLRPGEGMYLRQIATNTSTFRMGFMWTEE